MEDVATRLHDEGKLKAAEKIFKEMLTLDARCLGAHFELARVYRRMGKLELALFHARRTLRFNPKEKNASLNLAIIYDLLRKDALALKYYKRELKINPGSVETYWNLGRLYFYKHRFRPASKYLRLCFERGFWSDMDDTVYKLGICYQKLSDVRPYIDVYKRYSAIVPSAGWAAANVGYALLHIRDYRGAVLWLSRAQRMDSSKRIELALARARNGLAKTTKPKLNSKARQKRSNAFVGRINRTPVRARAKRR